MQHVITLISASDDPQVDDALSRAVADLAGPNAVMSWLDPGIASDIVFEPSDRPLEAVQADIQDCLGDKRIDWSLQPVAHRRKALLIADMDSTLIGQECIDELAAEVGVKDHVAAITERAMRGEIAFEPAVRERVSVLEGLDESVIDRVIETRIHMTPGAETLVQTMRANGAYCAIVSGGFTQFTGFVAAALGFHEHNANTLLASDGKLLGKVAEPILAANAKRRRLEDLIESRNIDRLATMAVGDGANDLDMIGAAGLGVAFRAKPIVATQADAQVNHADLTALLFMQGYRREDFIER